MNLTLLASASINSLLGSTASPMSMAKVASAIWASPMQTFLSSLGQYPSPWLIADSQSRETTSRAIPFARHSARCEGVGFSSSQSVLEMVSYSFLLFAPDTVRQMTIQVRELLARPSSRSRSWEIIIRMVSRHDSLLPDFEVVILIVRFPDLQAELLELVATLADSSPHLHQ